METKAKEKAERALAALNKFLETRTYLVGDSVTLADIVIACSLYYGFTALFSAAYIKGYPHVGRYFSTLVNQPKFKAVLGEVKQCQETPLDVLPPEKNPFLHVIQRHARAAAGAGAAAAAGAGAAAAGAGVAAASQKVSQRPIRHLRVTHPYSPGPSGVPLVYRRRAWALEPLPLSRR